MINGYVTYDELLLITGLNDKVLNNLLLQGLNQHILDVDMQEVNKCYSKPLRERLFNLKEVEDWVKVHIF